MLQMNFITKAVNIIMKRSRKPRERKDGHP